MTKWQVHGFYFLPTEIVFFVVNVRAFTIRGAINRIKRRVRFRERQKIDYFTVTQIDKI